MATIQKNVNEITETGVANLLGVKVDGKLAVKAVSELASAAQGTKADSAVQPEDLATVATSGAYNDLSGKPTLGTAASTDSTSYATAAQGTKADTAVQPAAIGVTVQGFDAGLQSIAGLTVVTNRLLYTTGTDTYDAAPLSAKARELLADATSSEMRNTLELGSAATASTSSFATAAQGTKADTALQPADIGVTVQAQNGALQSIAGLNAAADRMLYTTSTNVWTHTPITSLARTLLDDTTQGTMRNTLGLGSASVANTTDFATAAQGTKADTAVQPADISTVTTSVATISALKAVTAVAGKVVNLLQGVPANNGRFGSFVCVAGSPPHADAQEGVYIVSNTASFYWKRIFTGMYNACWWGAVGDYSTDNAAAHAAVIAFCIATNKDSAIYYPSGGYYFNSSVNGYRASSGVTLSFFGDGFDSTYILSNYYDAASVMWDFIDPSLTNRVAPTNFVGLQFGSVSRSGGVNPRYLRIHGWGNSEMREVKFGPSNNTQLSGGGMQNIKMDRVESWYGGKSWLWTATNGLTFNLSGTTLTAASGTPFLASDASSDQYFTLNHSTGRRRYRINTYTSSTQVELESADYRLTNATGVTGWFGHGLVSATAASNQFFYPTGKTGPFTSADVGRVVLIKRADEGTYNSADFSILRGVIKSVTSDRVFRLGDDAGNDLPAYRTVTDAGFATPAFDFYQPNAGSDTLKAGSSHVEITKLHMEHYGGLAMFIDNADAWLIQGKIHGETNPTDTFGSTAAIWANDFGGDFIGILDSSVSLGGERVYA